MATPVIDDDIFEMEKVPMGNSVRGAICHDSRRLAKKQGVAEQMLNAAVETARQLDMTSMALTCKEHLIHYYARFGFEKQGISASVHGGAVWYDMVKTL